MTKLADWGRAALVAIWNVLAVHGLFHLEDGLELRSAVTTVAIALVVSWAVIRWWRARSVPPRVH